MSGYAQVIPYCGAYEWAHLLMPLVGWFAAGLGFGVVWILWVLFCGATNDA